MAPKPRVLHIGDNIKYNHDIYQRFASEFELIQPTTAERQREEFKRALKERRWGDFDAVFRPFWNTGGEMGRWDAELISLLPESVKVIASAGAGYDWADVDVFAKHGLSFPFYLPMGACQLTIYLYRNRVLQRRRSILGIRRRHDPLPHPSRFPQLRMVPPSRPLNQPIPLPRRTPELPTNRIQPARPHPGYRRHGPDRVHDRTQSPRRPGYEDPV